MPFGGQSDETLERVEDDSLETPGGHPKFKRLALAGPFSLVAIFVLMAWATWRKWGDILVDFGLQLYVPWQLSTGQTLHQDVAYLSGGPLSQLYNSLLFDIFGVSFTVLILANLASFISVIVVLYKSFRKTTDVLTATMVGLAAIMGFAFAQYGDNGNYNFVSPYSHEAIHGVILSIFCLAALSSTRLGSWKFALAGGCYGGVLLTKPELFLALTLSLVGYGLLWWWKSRQLPLKKCGVFLATAFLLPSVVFFYFLAHESFAESIRHLLWAWVPLLTTSAVKNQYYQWALGFDTPALHVRNALLHSGVLVISVAFLAWRCRKMPSNPKERLMLVCVAGLFVLGAIFFDWVTCGRALPFLILTTISLQLWKFKTQPDTAVRFPLLLALFGFLVLSKLGFHTRIWHYGFYLAFPAFLSAVYFLTWLLPEQLRGFGIQPKLLRGVICLVLLVGFAQLAAQSNHQIQQKTVQVGTGGDRLFASESKLDISAKCVESALVWIEGNIAPGETLAVLPEGAMINYLSKRRNPTPYLNFNPPEIAAFGEDKMQKAYVQNPPDYVMLVHRDGGEFGVPYFGRSAVFGRMMMDWVNENYEPVHLIGNEPLKNSLFGIKILKRK